MTRRLLFLLLIVLCAVAVARTSAQGRAAPGAARPSFDGIWKSGTATPLERPSALRDKPFFTVAEAAEFERQAAAANEEPDPD
ncbi:MAG: hypothetical protein ABL982_14050, partial [Vicinamibacterales bacterium]